MSTDKMKTLESAKSLASVRSSDSDVYLEMEPGAAAAAAKHGGITAELPQGTCISASGHIITAIVGAGVLGLPKAVALLGWPSGLTLLLIFFLVTLWTSYLLTEVHEVNGVRYERYGELVERLRGKWEMRCLVACQFASLILTDIGYTVTAGTSIHKIVHLYCTDENGEDCADDTLKLWQCVLIFSACQVGLSMIKNMESAWWTSAIGAIMSLVYSIIALVLGAANADTKKVSVHGIDPGSSALKTWGILDSLGTMCFAYSFAQVLIEIQATVADTPTKPHAVTMKKAVTIGVITSVVLYIGVGITGYLALGENTPGEILTGFSGPKWAVTIANLAVLIHMFGAYQVMAQPVLAALDRAAIYVLPGSMTHPIWRRAAMRLPFVGLCAIIAAIMPFFTVFVGLIGAVVFWLPAVHMPIALHQKMFPPTKFQRIWMGVIDAIAFVVCALAIVASVRGMIVGLEHAKFFD